MKLLACIPDVDSSGWAANPCNYGMSPRDYIQSESRSFFADFLKRSGINTFFHFTGLSRASDHWVVSPNNDTIYSIATVNARNGFTLTLPDIGKRFIATQIITENHMTPFYIYGSGTYKFSADDFDTDFVAVGIRTGTNGTEADVKNVVEELQPQYAITGAAPEDELTKVDIDTLKQVRKAMLVEYSKLPDTFNTMRKRTNEVVNWERFAYVTAGAWGLSPDENAMYAIGGPKNAKGGTCYTAKFPTVPVEAFFSITVYGPDKYLMTDKDNIISSNRGVKTNPDGSFEVAFGGENCRGLAPNYAVTPTDGWSLPLRAYKPDVAAFRAYAMPEIVPAKR